MKNENGRRRGIIVGGVSAFITLIYAALAGGLIGRFFSSYGKHDRELKSGLIMSATREGSHVSSTVKRAKFGIAEQFSGSFILHIWKRIVRFLLGCSMRFYGSFTFVFGVYSALIYLLKRFAFVNDTSDIAHLIFAVMCAVISVPMLISRKPLAQTLLESRAGSFLVVRIFGIPSESLLVAPAKHGESYNISIVMGLVLGTATYFIEPWALCIFAAVPVAVAMILSNPEIGVLLSVACIPFVGLTSAPEELLTSLVLLYSVAYGLKLICGRRTVQMGIYELILLIFGLLIFVSGRISVGEMGGEDRSVPMLIMIIGSFVALNLIRTEAWIRRCGIAFIGASIVTSAVIMWQFVAANSTAAEMGRVVFIGLTQGFFVSKDALAAYFIVSCMVTVAMMPSTVTTRAKIVALVGILMNVCALAAIGSFSGCVGLLVALIVYSLIVSRKTLPVLFICGMAIVLAFLLVPSLGRTLSVLFAPVDMELAATVTVWQGTMRMLAATLLMGIGVNAFERVYPVFAIAGSENAQNCASFLLRLLCDVGIVGTVVFCTLTVLFAKNCFEHIMTENDRRARLFTVGGLCAVCGMLAQSVFFDMWSDPAVFYMFWIVTALVCANIRQRRTEMDRQRNLAGNSESAATVELVLE